MEGYYYQEGFCPSDHLHGFYPVKYIYSDDKSVCMKNSMACTRLENGNCDKYAECEMFDSAPDIVGEKERHIVYSKKLG